MDSSTVAMLAALVALVALSAYFSATETAFTSLNRIRLKTVITLNIRHLFPSVGDALRNASFTVASIVSTTGFSTADFDMWPELSRTIIVLIMFIGACAGSTGGGIKVSRVIILLKTVKKELFSLLHP